MIALTDAPAPRIPDERLTSEKSFHDNRFATDSRKSLGFIYGIVAPSRDYFQNHIFSECRGKKVLEYGCGLGSHAFQLAQQSAKQVFGVDISTKGLQLAHERASSEGQSNIHFAAGDCEQLPYANQSFDLVIGTSILHHLDLNRSLSEIGRVLKTDGMAAFIEPLDYNPFIALFRVLTPSQRTPDEHPFRLKDIRLLRQKFGRVQIKYFHLTTLLLIPLTRFPLTAGLVRLFSSIDQALFAIFPFLRPLAWQVVMFLEAPRSDY